MKDVYTESKDTFKKPSISIKTMSYSKAMYFISNSIRAETYDNPVVYCKALRAALQSLGYDGSWVNGEFRSLLEDYVFQEN